MLVTRLVKLLVNPPIRRSRVLSFKDSSLRKVQIVVMVAIVEMEDVRVGLGPTLCHHGTEM